MVSVPLSLRFYIVRFICLLAGRHIAVCIFNPYFCKEDAGGHPAPSGLIVNASLLLRLPALSCALAQVPSPAALGLYALYVLVLLVLPVFFFVAPKWRAVLFLKS